MNEKKYYDRNYNDQFTNCFIFIFDLIFRIMNTTFDSNH